MNICEFFEVNPEPENEVTKASSTKEATGAPEAVNQLPPFNVMTRLILIMVWRKLMRNPNTYSSLIGLIWSLVHFRYITLKSLRLCNQMLHIKNRQLYDCFYNSIADGTSKCH